MPGLQNPVSLVVISQQFAKADLGVGASIHLKYAWTTFCNALKGKWGIGQQGPLNWYARGPVYDFTADLVDESVTTFDLPFTNLRSFIVFAYSNDNVTQQHRVLVPSGSSNFTINLTGLGACKLMASNIEF